MRYMSEVGQAPNPNMWKNISIDCKSHIIWVKDKKYCEKEIRLRLLLRVEEVGFGCQCFAEVCWFKIKEDLKEDLKEAGFQKRKQRKA